MRSLEGALRPKHVVATFALKSPLRFRPERRRSRLRKPAVHCAFAAMLSSNGCGAGWPTRNSLRGWKSWCAIAAWTGRRMTAMARGRVGDARDHGAGSSGALVLARRGDLAGRGRTGLAAAQGSDPEVVARLEELVVREEAATWASLRIDRCDFAWVLRVEARQQHSWLQQPGQGGGVPRLAYLLNPLMPCSGPVAGRASMGGAAWRTCCLRWRLTSSAKPIIARPGRVDTPCSRPLFPRAWNGGWTRICPLKSATPPGHGCIAEGGAGCWRSCKRDCMSGHCPGWLRGSAAQAGPVLATWRNRERRAALEERLKVT